MGRKRCLQVSSFGHLSHFTKENKPKGAGHRCLDCSVEPNCPYSARKIYLERAEKGAFHWPVSVVCSNSGSDIETLTEALRLGPYGRCVYDCDNDVVSHQVVNMEFEGGATAAFTMVAFTEKLGVRMTTIYGTKGELSCKGEGGDVEIFDFLQKKKTSFSPQAMPDIPACLNGHCGADYYLIHNFVSAVLDFLIGRKDEVSAFMEKNLTLMTKGIRELRKTSSPQQPLVWNHPDSDKIHPSKAFHAVKRYYEKQVSGFAK
uniref:Uncharacterized protein n=1 Tax=Pseudonaja textilis TaxID=8673 RepID=A0A670ZN17_PSETE